MTKFISRIAAGRLLAKKLQRLLPAQNAVVVSVPRGGIVVGHTVANMLGLPHDVVTPRKIGQEKDKEWAVGAVMPDGSTVWLPEKAANESKTYLAAERRKQIAEALRRLKKFRTGRPPLRLKNKTVILVDDGIATGMTLLAAAESLRKRGVLEVFIAAPVASPVALTALRGSCAQIIALLVPKKFACVGKYYRSFRQVSDESALAYLKKDRRRNQRRVRHTASGTLDKKNSFS